MQKSDRKFSMIAMDHNHEQENAIVKGVGGAIRLTENDATLRRWCACVCRRECCTNSKGV